LNSICLSFKSISSFAAFAFHFVSFEFLDWNISGNVEFRLVTEEIILLKEALQKITGIALDIIIGRKRGDALYGFLVFICNPNH
jgi:hypothetical protein